MGPEDVVARLLDVDLALSYGSPDAVVGLPEEVRARLPELAGRGDEEVEEEVVEAFSSLTSQGEVVKRSRLITQAGLLIEAALYRCSRPGLGQVYVAYSQRVHEDSGQAHLYLYASRDYARAYERYEVEAAAVEEAYFKVKEAVEKAGGSVDDEVVEYELEL